MDGLKDGGPIRTDGLRAVLLDVEGTTTPVSFVHEVLFPYARARLRAHIEEGVRSGSARADVELLRAEQAADRARGAGPPFWRQDDDAALARSASDYAAWLMQQDRKSTGLKSLQGKIWEVGYRRGDLRGEVYPDVPDALRRWRARGLRLAIFSSGSVLAQRLLFGTTPSGDLTPLLDGHFDTTTGAKNDPAAYRRIAAAMKVEADAVLFLSDTAGELEAARGAGLRTALCARGAAPRDAPGHAVIRSFAEVLP